MLDRELRSDLTTGRPERISAEYVKQNLLFDDPTCHACPVACKKEVETHGKYTVHMESFEYEPAWSLGANCDNDNRESIAFIIDLCNDYGMDAIEHGQVLGLLAAEITLLAGERSLASGTRVRLHLASAEVLARVKLLGERGSATLSGPPRP